MRFPRTVRAWLVSVPACAGLLAAWVLALQLLSGRTQHVLHNMADVAIGFAAVYAIAHPGRNLTITASLRQRAI